MRELSQTTRFARDVKRMRKRGKDLAKLRVVVGKLAAGERLSPLHGDHPLIGPWKHTRDCHIEPDRILIYSEDERSLRLERAGTHSDLFE